MVGFPGPHPIALWRLSGLGDRAASQRCRNLEGSLVLFHNSHIGLQIVRDNSYSILDRHQYIPTSSSQYPLHIPISIHRQYILDIPFSYLPRVVSAATLALSNGATYGAGIVGFGHAVVRRFNVERRAPRVTLVIVFQR